MTLNIIFYTLKPFIPRSMQLAVRRIIAQRKRRLYSDVWPIDPNAGNPPPGWKGWPDGKKFALVIQHDVDTQKGHNNCYRLMEIEKGLGIRSLYSIVPERYKISRSLLDEISNQGFGIGVHGLKHDGKLFSSEQNFRESAIKINNYMKEWKSTGFTSPSMHRNLGWMHILDVEYSTSTFDTDPFGPQPEGVGTIFPLFIQREYNHRGFVELPYTLPQDHLLYIILKEKNIDIWKKKLDWIAEKGGMALFNTHPDYMNFNDAENRIEEYLVKYYTEFIEYIETRYKDQYWQALPGEVAQFWVENVVHEHSIKDRELNGKYIKEETINTKLGDKLRGKKIWIDLDNTPHVPFFRPIIDELNSRGYECYLTARDAYGVIDLADYFGLKYKKVGHHYGKNKMLKVIGLVIRSLQIFPAIVRQKPALAVSHGSRTQIVSAGLLGIPSLVIFDYEYTQGLVVINPTYAMSPEIIPDSSIKIPKERIFKYPGIKEDVYVPSFIPDPSIKNKLKIDDFKLVITVRPPATEAHYFCQASGALFEASMKFLLKKEETQLILLPRNKKQEIFIKENWAQAYESGKIIIPNHAINGLDLMWYSDLVISGGGTMNREAAALGIPVYSIFRGTIGAVDKYLSENGRLVLLESPEDLEHKLKLVKRDKNRKNENNNKQALNTIVNKIVEIVEGKNKVKN